MPNHMNIIIKTEKPLFTGTEAGYHAGTCITFNLNS